MSIFDRRGRWARVVATFFVTSFFASAASAQSALDNRWGLESEQLPGSGDLVGWLPLPEWLEENLRLTVDLASRTNYHEERAPAFRCPASNIAKSI